MSADAFRIFLSVLTAIASTWALTDIYKLIRLRGADRDDPIVRDKVFGYWIGTIVGTCGFIGILRYNGVI